MRVHCLQVALLENVLAFRPLVPTLEKLLELNVGGFLGSMVLVHACARYQRCYVTISPSLGSMSMLGISLRQSYGAPLDRRRLFAIMARNDVVCKGAKVDFQGFIEKRLLAMKMKCKRPWSLLYL